MTETEHLERVTQIYERRRRLIEQSNQAVREAVEAGVTMTAVAEAIGMSRQGVARIVGR